MLATHPIDAAKSSQTGRFTLVSVLGRGSTSVVYLARMHSPSGVTRRVAIKLLQEIDPQAQTKERLLDEARLLASLRHPAIPTIYDLTEIFGCSAIVTEFIEGEDLASCVVGSDRMPVRALLEVIEQVSDALNAAWCQRAVIHRDVSLQNIRVGSHGDVKLLDFGLARANLEERAAKTSPGVMLGVPGYLAPELYRFEGQPSHSSDVFSLGCVLYEGITGRSLTHGLSLLEVCRLTMMPDGWTELVRHRLREIDAPDAVAEPLRELLREMLGFDPEARPSASEVALRCAEIIAIDPSRVSLARFCRERRWKDPSEDDETTLIEDGDEEAVEAALESTVEIADEPTEQTKTTEIFSREELALLASRVTPAQAPARRDRRARWLKLALSLACGSLAFALGLLSVALIVGMSLG